MQYVTDMSTPVIIIVPVTSSLKMMAITIINYPLKHRMRWSSFTNGFSSALNWSSAATVPNNHITVHTSTGQFKNGPKIT